MRFFLLWKLCSKLAMNKIVSYLLKDLVTSLPLVLCPTPLAKRRASWVYSSTLSPAYTQFFLQLFTSQPKRCLLMLPFGSDWRSGGTRSRFGTVRRSNMQPHTQDNHLLTQSWAGIPFLVAIVGTNIHNNCALKTCICGSMAKTTGKLFLAQQSSK